MLSERRAAAAAHRLFGCEHIITCAFIGRKNGNKRHHLQLDTLLQSS